MEDDSEQKNSSTSLEIIVGSALRSIGAVFPITAVLASGWSEWKNHQQPQNVQDVMNGFAQRLQELEDKVDRAYLESDDAKRLIMRTAQVARNESRGEKKQMLSAFLANASTQELSSDREKDMILDVVDKLSPLGAQLLRMVTENLVFGRGHANVRLGSDYDPKAKDKPEFGYVLESTLTAMLARQRTPKEVEATLAYLCALGVLERHSARGWSTVGGSMGVIGVRPTKLGLTVLEYLGVNVAAMPDDAFRHLQKAREKHEIDNTDESEGE